MYNERSSKEYDQYEKGLKRSFWRYFRFSGLQEKNYRNKLVKKFLKEKNINDLKILELGGSKWSELIHDLFDERPRELICINISPSEINLAKKEASKLGTRYKPQWLEMDAHELQFDDEYFDVILGFGMLHHLDLDIALSEIKRVLGPDGVAFFREPLDINPILSLGRLFTPQARTEDEIPFKKIHLDRIESFFPNAHFFFEQFFTFFTSPLVIIIPNIFRDSFIKIFYKFDKLLLNISHNIGYLFRSVFIVLKKN